MGRYSFPILQRDKLIVVARFQLLAALMRADSHISSQVLEIGSGEYIHHSSWQLLHNKEVDELGFSLRRDSAAGALYVTDCNVDLFVIGARDP